MKCVHCGRTDSDQTDKQIKCTCYTWFMYTCAVCLTTVLFGLACCLYCTYMLTSINKTVTTCVGSIGDSSLQEKGVPDISNQEETKTVEMSFAHVTKLRRKRKAQEIKKQAKRRRGGRKEKGKKKQKTQAAHFFLKQGLSDAGANCPLGRRRQHGSGMTRVLDIFQLATFINAKSNPFIAMDGKFIAKKRGLYLVYAQILFEDCRADEIMKIVQGRKVNNEEIIIQEHFCFVGVPKTDKSYNNTCSLNALFFLEANDYLTVMNYYPEVHINYRSNSTFFGAVYLR